MDIKAALIRAPGAPFSIEEVELDAPRDYEVVVRIRATGICHTDLSIRDHPVASSLPMVLGHEGAGVVTHVGTRVSKVRPGDHVVLTYHSCGTCSTCQREQFSYCRNFLAYNLRGHRPDGSPTIHQGAQTITGSFFGQSSFATSALAYERNVVKVRRDVPLELLGPLGCGVQTGAGAVINALQPRVGSSIAIFGTGTVGLSALMAAAAIGCAPIIGVDVHTERLSMAREFGATHTVNAAEEDPIAAIRAITNGGVAYSLEAVGQPSVLRQAVDVLAPTGICGLIGLAAPGAEVKLAMGGLLGRTVRGIMEGDSVPDSFIPALIERYVAGQLPFDRLLRFYPFAQINQAAQDALSGTVIKPVLQMS